MSVKDIDLYAEWISALVHIMWKHIRWHGVLNAVLVDIIEQVSTAITKYGTPLHLLQTLVA